MEGFQCFIYYLVALLGTLQAANAHQCHSCKYMKSGNEEFYSPACENPSKGNLGDMLLTGCNSGNSGIEEKPKLFACGKLSVTDGKLAEDNSTVSYGVVRGCVGVTFDLGDGCKDRTVADWNRFDDNWSMWVNEGIAALGLASTTKVTACYCSKDECNDASSLKPPIRVLTILVAFTTVFLFEFK